MSKEVPKKDKSYFLRTQSSILKGQQNIPLNSLKSQIKHINNSYSKNENNKTKKRYINFSTGNKQIKSKKYITSKKNNDKMFKTFSNFGGIDLNQVSGSSHSSKFMKKNNIIIPKEGDTFSISGNNIEKQNNNIYRINKDNENGKNLINKNIYNSRLYSPFYELIEKINRRSYNHNNDLNRNGNNFNENMTNSHFLSSNRIIEINNKDKNNLNKYINKGNIKYNDSQNPNIKNNEYDKYKNNIDQKFFNDNYNENEYLNDNKLFTKSEFAQNEYTNNNQPNCNELYFNTQTNIKENLDTNEPKEEYKDSIIAKAMNLLTNNHNNNERYNIGTTYQMQSSSYFNDSNLNKNYINNNNNNDINYNYDKSKDPNESFRIIYNKYPNHQKLTYHYHESKNNSNSNRIHYNNNSTNRNNSNRRTNSLYNNNENISLNDRLIKKNEINDNNINTINNMNNMNNINNMNDINNGNSRNNENLFLSTQKSNYFNDNNPKIFNHSEVYYQGNLNPNLSTKYFLKPVFDENSTNNYIKNFNNFSPLKQNNNTVLLTNYNINDINIKKERRLTPNNNLLNVSNSNKLRKLLKDIPSHKKEKINKFNEILSNINGDLRKKNKSFDICDINKKIKSVEDIEGIMPPNVIICNQQ